MAGLRRLKLKHLLALTLIAASQSFNPLCVDRAFAESIARANPAEAGLSPAGLKRIGAYLENEIATSKIPGAIMMIQRHGKVAYYETFGARDPAAKGV